MIDIERETIHEDGSTELKVFKFGVMVNMNTVTCKLTGIKVFKKSKSQRNKRLLLSLESYRTDDRKKMDNYKKDESILIDAEEALRKLIHVTF
ncbi:hypothetical protein PaeCFBP13512_22390 [Paenibacillus sp. CFBP13512]|uniref:hypothetical protein n=1 Tax=Paenibacillus sp. CFBP13512 TaxID=2184007 RepID=UPI0010C10598|nr:hypothetical protein [Paenibacillus sp. CFBP13512]TKJ83768.1 hypothetical protein PaeCFBP13512_22390 [Paenibacillus sp. CFBP13512]